MIVLIVLKNYVLQKKSKTVNTVEEEVEEGKDLHSEATFKELLDHLYSQTDNEDRPLWKMFDKLPSKEDFPVYYDYIDEPIDLRTIKKNIQNHHYTTIDELEIDILLLIKNAHAFNEPKSQISKDATALKKAYFAKRLEINKYAMGAKVSKRIKTRRVSHNVSADSDVSESTEQEDDDKSEPDTPKDKHMSVSDPSNFVSSPSHVVSMERKNDGLIGDTFEPNVFSTLYNSVISYEDNTGRKLSTAFLKLPNKKIYPGYYEVIKKPLAFGKIRTKIKSNYYSDLNILEKDFNIIFDNSKLYNKPGSLLHTDAGHLQVFMSTKKSELEKTVQYLAMREIMPKRGRPKLVKTECFDDPLLTPAIKKRIKQDGYASPTIEMNDPKYLKKRLLQMYNCVLDYKDSEGRVLSSLFLELPDRKEYPEYYKIIPNPIDMETIQDKIQMGYASEDDFMHDFERLFQNARHFNEEGSEVYEDSIVLEKALKKRRRWLNHLAEGKMASPMKVTRQSNSPSLLLRKSGQFATKCQELLYHICNYMDDSGRSLAAPFEKLPSRIEYPDYYQLIKKPIDLSYITSRVNKYASIDDLEQDLLLLFDNACHYNEPDSQIYKDALVLLRSMIQKKAELAPDVENVLPDVAALVAKLLKTLYLNVMNHRDEEGRCYSDSLLEVLANSHDDGETPTDRKPISLPIIGQLLKLGLYKRLDRLQEDMFSVFKKARKEGRTDSEMYEDACEMQLYFILERDRLTKDGLRLTSQALHFTTKSVQHEIEDERNEKQLNECKEDDDENDDESRKSRSRLRGVIAVEVQPDEDDLTFMRSVTIEDLTYRVGDFVYVKAEEINRPPHIVSVDKIWTQKDGLQGFYGCWYYRPEATFHLASRKFMEKEVFRSHHSSFIMFKGVIGRCYVMNIKEYSKMKPEGFADDDIYVCESRYNGKSKAFKKIKTFQAVACHIIMRNRSEPLQIKRVSSVFASSNETQSEKREKEGLKEEEELTSIEGYEFVTEKNSVTEVPNPEEDCIYYEKYATNNTSYKIGDSVYVRSDEDYLLLSKIDRMWTNSSGTAYFQGNWYLWPEDTKHVPTQLFNEQECFESNIEEVTPISKIAGKCSILNLRDYQTSRPCEVKEKDIYLCSAHYNEDEMKFRRRVKGFKRLTLPAHIRGDEYWYFDQPYNPKRRPSLWLMSCDNSEESDKMDDTDDVKTGFELLKEEFTASLLKKIPELSMESILSKTEERWKSLTIEQQDSYHARARVERFIVYECAWSHCDYQFEDLQDLMVHVMEGSHLVKSAVSGLFPCEWRSCQKQLRNFPTHSRLVRHIREIHFKESPKTLTNSEKSKYFFPRHQTCDDAFKQSESSDRPSSLGSSTNSSLSPFGNTTKQLPTNQQQISMGMAQNMANSQMQMQAGMFPPFRMNNQPPPQVVMQQQILQQQQQMMMQARGQMMAAPPPPPRVQIPPQQQQPPPPPPQQAGGLLTVEQQQMLITQVQQQQQQIQQLQQQVQRLTQQQTAEEQAPVFIAPPANTQKLRHSEAYLRYIEGLRDNKPFLSNWSELSDAPHPKPQNPLPTHWLQEGHGFKSNNDALWALRDHMLRDAVSL